MRTAIVKTAHEARHVGAGTYHFVDSGLSVKIDHYVPDFEQYHVTLPCGDAVWINREDLIVRARTYTRGKWNVSRDTDGNWCVILYGGNGGHPADDVARSTWREAYDLAHKSANDPLFAEQPNVWLIS